MKTYILQLDPHDDIISVGDKMNWAKAGRILVVWPERGKVLNRRLDLILLKRKSQAIGSQLAFVSTDREVRYHAPRLGIPVFKRLKQAQKDSWRLPRRFRQAGEHTGELPKPPEQSQPDSAAPTRLEKLYLARPKPSTVYHPIVRLAFFALGVAAVLSLAAALLPTADINLQPEIRLQEIVIEVQASENTQATNISGAIPLRWINIVVEGRESIAASGSMRLPNRPATGQVIFTNLTDQAVPIPEGSVVRSLGEPPLRFVVTQAGQTPPGPGETVTLPVRCLNLGSQGNLPAGSLTAIEGLLGAQVSANNPEPTRNGSERSEPVPTNADRAALYEQLLAALRESALTELRRIHPAGDLLVETSLETLRVHEEIYLPAANQPADRLTLSLRVEFQVLAASGDDLQWLAASVLDASTPTGFVALSSTLQFDPQQPLVLIDGVARWKLVAHRQIQAQINPSQSVRLILGLPPGEASQRLSQTLPLAGEPEIRLSPAWWPRLPILPARISISQ
jgi:hypothetical protein